MIHVSEKIVEIGNTVSDDEGRAHALEDELYRDVLIAIANGAGNSRELATEALKTAEIDFTRWCE
jgi:3-isopropylmalate dehydratase small subunit